MLAFATVLLEPDSRGLVPAIHVLLAVIIKRKTWMPGTRPGMTERYVFAQPFFKNT
jgi:hypothetical protein